MKWYFDTTVLVAAAVSAHPHHGPALNKLEELARGKHEGFLSAHGLTEVYSVLTRTPFRPPVYPSEALRIIEDEILGPLKLVSLDAREYVRIVRRAGDEGWIGGRIHDAVHLQCALKMDCDRVYTFNVADFRALAPKELVARIAAP